MSTFSSPHSRSKLPLFVVLLVIVIAALGAGVYFLGPRFESDPPQIVLTPNAEVVGAGPIEILVTDKGSGLKSITAVLSQGGSDHPLAGEQFGQPVGEKKLTVTLAKVAGVKEGPAVLRVTARDASLWHSFKGNEAVLEKNVTIDTTPPTINLVADDRYVNFGGVGVIVY